MPTLALNLNIDMVAASWRRVNSNSSQSPPFQGSLSASLGGGSPWAMASRCN